MITDDTAMPFGKKHRGTPMRHVPSHYLKWCLENVDKLHEDMREYIEQRLGDPGRAVTRGDDAMTDDEVDESRGMSNRDTSSCKTCGADIRWIKVNGKNIPLDCAEKKVYIRRSTGWTLATGYETHFATCPQADQHRGTGQQSTESEEPPDTLPAKDDDSGLPF